MQKFLYLSVRVLDRASANNTFKKKERFILIDDLNLERPKK